MDLNLDIYLYPKYKFVWLSKQKSATTPSVYKTRVPSSGECMQISLDLPYQALLLPFQQVGNCKNHVWPKLLPALPNTPAYCLSSTNAAAHVFAPQPGCSSTAWEMTVLTQIFLKPFFFWSSCLSISSNSIILKVTTCRMSSSLKHIPLSLALSAYPNYSVHNRDCLLFFISKMCSAQIL